MSIFKTNKRLFIAIAILLVLVIAANIIYFLVRPKSITGNKSITVSVILVNGDKSVHNISTNAEFLSEVLLENSLIPPEDVTAGFVTTIEGITADMTAEEWWMVTVDGEFSNYGINDLAIEDGCSYEFTLSVGWDF